MNFAKTMMVIFLSLALVLCFAGCGLIDNLQSFKDNDESQEQEPEEIVIEEGVNIEPGDTTEPEQSDAMTSQDSGSEDSREVVLYFANSDGTSLEGETRAIPKQEGIARATINELIAGPVDANLSPTLPAATILEDINIADGVCTVDFSTDFLTDLSSDQEAQMLALYSIVNTLTQFDSVDYVRILVNGQALDSLAGVDVSTVLAPFTW
jgi:germination protein M